MHQRSLSRGLIPKETSHGTGHVAVEFFGVRGFKRTEQQQEIVISAFKGLEEVREIFMKTAAGRGATKEICFLVSATNYS